jgi:2,4-dienoyl-CoA reductase-like NADH-dependent reductase (Old Yellow Enzyme family)
MNAYEDIKKGLKLEESTVQARMMADMGFDGIEVSGGIMEDNFSHLRGNFPIELIADEWEEYRDKGPFFRFFMKKFGPKFVTPPPVTQAYNREGARAIKAMVSVPVFSIGGITDPLTMEDIVRSGDADYVSLGRALISDPNFPRKIQEGSTKPARCIHCNYCIGYIRTRPLQCYYGKRVKKNV